jgi:hypothetical protein
MSPKQIESIACHAMHVSDAIERADAAVAALARLSPELRKAVVTGSAASVRKAIRRYSVSLADAMGIPCPVDNSDKKTGV